MDRENKQNHFNIWKLLTALFIVAALVFLGIFLKTVIDQKNRADGMSRLASSKETEENAIPSEPISTVLPKAPTSVNATEEIEATPEPEDPYEKSIRLIKEAGIPIPELEVNIEELQETVNPDIYAWIYVPGTKVNYPVLQHPSDDSHYLNYNIDGSKGYPGCVYSERLYNGKDFTDVNTVLYGHNMKNGTMFGSLHKYEDEDFFYENRYIYVYLPDRLLAYQIFAAYEHSNEHLLYNNNFNDSRSFCYYFEEAKKERSVHRIFDEEVELTGEGQHILTLSTCINNKPENRFLVQGVLINEESFYNSPQYP